MRKTKIPAKGLNAAEWAAVGLFSFLLVGCYLRLFVSVGLMGLQDEYHWVGAAALSSLGGIPFVNDLNIQQLCGLVYEPLVWLYVKLFGLTGVLLFVRHLYFALALGAAALLYKSYREKTDLPTALMIASLPLVTAFWGQPSLGYNAIGGLGFLSGSLLALAGLEERRLSKVLLGALFYFFALAAYPTLVGAVALFWLTVLAVRLSQRKPVLKEFALANALTILLLLAFIGWLVGRAGWDQLLLAYQFSTSQSSMGNFWSKFRYGLDLWIGFLPEWYWLAGSMGLWLAAWWRFRISWIFFAVPVSLWIALREPPEPGPFYPALYLLLALSGLPIVVRGWRADPKKAWADGVLWTVCLVSVLFPWWSSALTLYVTFITSTYCLAPILALGRERRASPWLGVLAFVIPFAVFTQKVAVGQLDDATTDVELLTEGPYAGLITSRERAEFLRQLAGDIRSAGDVKSAFFYDEFPLGYLMTGLKPATPTLFTHGLRESFAVRPYYNRYFSVPTNRPDLIVRFNHFPVAGNRLSVHPDQYKPYPDVFWKFPEESGSYEPVVQRDAYSIFKRSPAR